MLYRFDRLPPSARLPPRAVARLRLRYGDLQPATDADAAPASAPAPTSPVEPAPDPEALLRVPEGSDDPYTEFEAIMRSVESGAVAPLRGSWVLSLYESGGRLKRRQELPPEAFWTAAELRVIIDTAKRHFADDVEAGREALGYLFNALSYRLGRMHFSSLRST